MTTKSFIPVFTVLVFCLFSKPAFAQSGNDISKSLGLYVFPSKGQTPETQDKDEADCFKWAKEQTGYDPMNPTKVEAAPVDTSPDGSAVKGAAKGAAAGAAIGAIGGDAGEGAAIGAVVGGISGRRAAKAKDAQQQQQSTQAVAATEKAMKDDYNKAFSACMGGKGYTIQ